MRKNGSLTVETEQMSRGSYDRNVVVEWDDAHRYTPAPRHRRRMMLRIIADLDVRDCLDAGCAQLYLLQEVVRRHGIVGYGCDISDQVIAKNQRLAPDCNFLTMDLSRETWPQGRQFDLVICSEVLEHIPDWRSALSNLVRMSRKYLLITVPGGKIRPIDRMVGHNYHFQGPELASELQELGCEIVQLRRWGFPIHSLYKILINKLSPEKLYGSFSETHYRFFRRLFSHTLYMLFYLNELSNSGDQLILLARNARRGES